MTADNGMDASPSWQELSRRVDEIEVQLSAAMDREERLREEFTDIAANAERLRQAGNRVIHYGAASDEWDSVVAAAPGDSLARFKAEWQAEVLAGGEREVAPMLKAQWQAEKLEEMAQRAGDRVGPWLMDEAAKLRRQAEGGE